MITRKNVLHFIQGNLLRWINMIEVMCINMSGKLLINDNKWKLLQIRKVCLALWKAIWDNILISVLWDKGFCQLDSWKKKKKTMSIILTDATFAWRIKNKLLSMKVVGKGLEGLLKKKEIEEMTEINAMINIFHIY